MHMPDAKRCYGETTMKSNNKTTNNTLLVADTSRTCTLPDYPYVSSTLDQIDPTNPRDIATKLNICTVENFNGIYHNVLWRWNAEHQRWYIAQAQRLSPAATKNINPKNSQQMPVAVARIIACISTLYIIIRCVTGPDADIIFAGFFLVTMLWNIRAYRLRDPHDIWKHYEYESENYLSHIAHQLDIEAQWVTLHIPTPAEIKTATKRTAQRTAQPAEKPTEQLAPMITSNIIMSRLTDDEILALINNPTSTPKGRNNQ